MASTVNTCNCIEPPLERGEATTAEPRVAAAMAPSMPSVKHSMHPAHELVHSDTGATFTCDGCRLDGRGGRFRCAACDFDLHVDCATAQPAISFAGHPAHAVVLCAAEKLSLRSCDVCMRSIRGQYYRCHSCDYDVHVLCAAAAAATPAAAATNLPHLFDKLSVSAASPVKEAGRTTEESAAAASPATATRAKEFMAPAPAQPDTAADVELLQLFMSAWTMQNEVAMQAFRGMLAGGQQEKLQVISMWAMQNQVLLQQVIGGAAVPPQGPAVAAGFPAAAAMPAEGRPVLHHSMSAPAAAVPGMVSQGGGAASRFNMQTLSSALNFGASGMKLMNTFMHAAGGGGLGGIGLGDSTGIGGGGFDLSSFLANNGGGFGGIGNFMGNGDTSGFDFGSIADSISSFQQ